MAAIIAQLTRYGPGRQIFPSQNIFYFRAQRERNNRVTYSTNKCLYDLPPLISTLILWFTINIYPGGSPHLTTSHWCQRSCFRKAKLLERQARRDEKSPSLEVLLRQNNRTSDINGKFTYKKCLLETVIIGNHWSSQYLCKISKTNPSCLCSNLIYSLIISIGYSNMKICQDLILLHSSLF